MDGSAVQAQRPCSRRASNVISARRSRSQRQMAGSGQAQKSRAGLRPEPEGAYIANAAGSICDGWAVLLLGGVAIAEMHRVAEVTSIPRPRGSRRLDHFLWH